MRPEVSIAVIPMDIGLIGAYQGPAAGKAAHKGEDLPVYYWSRRPEADSMPDRKSPKLPELKHLMLQVDSAAVDGG